MFSCFLSAISEFSRCKFGPVKLEAVPVLGRENNCMVLEYLYFLFIGNVGIFMEKTVS